MKHTFTQLFRPLVGKGSMLFLTLTSLLFSLNSFAHVVDSYTAACNAGPYYTVDANVSSVNASSNYAWQYKNNSGNWVCIVNGSNTINGITYTVNGAVSTATTNPVPIVFTNPGSSLQGLIIRCVISDGRGINPCNIPSGNTWNSDAASKNHSVNVNGTPCATNTNCSCPGNLVTNPSFESGTTGWSWSGGTLSKGTGAVACGSFSGDFQITKSTGNWVSQRIATDLPAGTIINASAYAGTHDNSFAHYLVIDFFNANNVWISNSVIEVNKVLSNAPTGPQLYSWSGTVPAGAKYVNVGFTGSGNLLKTDQWCVTTNTPAANGSIGDRVWLDADGDGIQDAGETAGLTGITVQLKNAAGTVIATTTTNAAGNYLFSGLAAGTYKVVFPVSISGAVVTGQNAGADDNVDSDAGQTSGETGSISLARGQNITNVDAGYCPTTLRLGNRVWNDVNNNGINDGEAGIPNAVVRLYKDNNNDNVPDGAAIAEVTTDAFGYYSFRNLVPGNYIVGVVTPAGFVSSSVNGGDPDNDLNFDDNGQVTVGSETRGLAITLIAGTEPDGTNTNTNNNITYDFGFFQQSPVLGSIGDRVWLDADGDGIQDPSETSGITGLTVQLKNSTGIVIATTTTNATGNYLFSGLVAGSYTVVFPTSISGSAVTVQNAGADDNVDSDASQTTGETSVISLAAGQSITNVDAGYSLTVLALGDNVFFDVNNNGVRDAPETGIPGLTVNLYRDNNNDNIADGAAIATTTTNGTGNYLFSNLAPGNYIVGVVPLAGYTSSTNPAVDPDNDTDRDDNGTNLAGTEWRGLAITLAAGTEFNGTASNTNTNVTYDFGFYQPAPASLGDRVWRDDNDNGIQDADEVGVAGVTVTLVNAAEEVVATTTTDAQGNYKFSNLLPGDYTVRITPPANYTLSAKDQGGNDNTDSDFDPITSTTGTISLAAGQNLTDVDAGLVFSQPITTTVGDRVWLDTNGNGVQDANEPGVSNVLVTLFNSAGVAVASTYSDVNGNYLFTNVAPGSYTVGVSLPPAFVFTANNGGVSDATNSDIIPATGRTVAFTVNAGDQIRYVDAGIKPQSTVNATVGDYVWNDLDKDGTQETGEPGIAGVTVRLINSVTNTVVATATTDAFGKYIFNDVAPGSYLVEFVTPSGYTTTTKANTNPVTSAVDSDVDPATGRTAAFTVAAGDRITTVDGGYWLTTPPGTGKIGDRVWNDVNGNGIQDAGEPSVAGITVTLYDGAGNVVKQTTTENGNYIFTDLAAGNYTVGFGNLPAGFTFTTQGAGTAASGSDANPATGRTGVISLGAGQVNLDVDAGIRPIAAGTASLGNKVWYDLNNNGLQDAGETGVQSVTVELLDAAGNPVDKDPVTPGVQPTTAITNALGEYLFTGLAAGDYRVRFSTLPAGYNPVAKGAGADRNIDSDGNPLTAGSSTTDVVTLGANQERLDIDLGIFNATAPLGQIGDRVWFDANNNGIQDAGEQGVPGVSVSLLDAAGNVIRTTITDKDGAYKFINLTDGIYSVQFDNLPAGFVFSPKDLGGNDSNDSDADPATGKTGNYTITGGATNLTVDAGIYSTRAALGDYVWFDTDADGVQDATESGVAGVTVTLYNTAGTAIASAITDQNGGYFFSNLDAGSYTVGFTTTPAQSVFTTQDAPAAGDAADSDVNPATGRTGTVTLAAGEVNRTVDAGIRTFIPATIGDFIWSDLDRDGLQDAGEPGIAGISVILYNSANQPIGSAITDGNGFYQITNVPPGTGYYLVFNNKPDAAAPWTTQNVGGAGANDNSKVNAAGQTGAFNVTEGQNITNLDAGLVKPISLRGNVWHDVNAMSDGFVNNSGAATTPPAAGIPVGLRAYLVNNSTGLVERVAFVNSANGTFSFSDISPNTVYSVVLSSAQGLIGNPPPAQLLPTGWENTGQKNADPPNSPSGNDGINDGKLIVPVVTTDVININFGIRLKGGDIVIG
jgi:hypothetical protein